MVNEGKSGTTEDASGKRALKNVRRREYESPDVGDQEMTGGRGFLSFKEALTGGVWNCEKKDGYECDDFKLKEGDVTTTNIDGCLISSSQKRSHPKSGRSD
ncbi:hypothetical protein Gotur_006896 [Gossypium turneri]